ncbi:MAG: hypothetical protein AB7I41_00840 [Candidatus Sericytochromatia bacterium]
MQKRSVFLSAALVLACLLPHVTQAGAQTGPKVIQRSLILNTYDHDRVWPDPKKEPKYHTPAWTPNNLNLSFMLEGPLVAGGQISLQFFKPDGKPWVSTHCNTPELAPGEVGEAKCEDIHETKAIAQTGMFPFKIQLKNELMGTNQDLFKGRLKVGKYTSKYNKTVEHFIDEDWRLPLAYVALDKTSDENSPPLIAYFWFRGRNLHHGSQHAFLYFNGQQVGATDSTTTGAANEILTRNANLEPLDPKKDYSYALWSFHFSTVRGYVQNPFSLDITKIHNLSMNNGAYEIKVLRQGKLSRVAKFTVNNGQIVAPGSVEKDGRNNERILIPAEVKGDLDGAIDPNAWKTEIYYGNPGPLTSGVLGK